MNKRIHVMYQCGSDNIPYGCSHIRLLCPLSHPSIKEKISLSFGADLPDFPVDLVIIERGARHGFTLADQAHLFERLRVLDVPYVYEIDDNLLDLNAEPGAPDFPFPEERQLIIRFARSARSIVVSTPALKRRMERLNPNIHVIANHLDERLFDFDLIDDKDRLRRTEESEGVVFGYMGTYSHLDDLLMIAEPLRQFLFSRKERVRMEVVGIGDEVLIREIFGSLPVSVVNVPGDRVEYSRFMDWMQTELTWDFAIAPLIDSDFNDCKSDLKFLDYSINRIPGIYSATPSYADTVIDKKNGLLVSADSGSWLAALEVMADDPSVRWSLSEAACSYTREFRTLRTNSDQWVDVIESALNSAKEKIHEAEHGERPFAPKSALTRNERILSSIDIAGLGLEIGPSFSPVLPKARGYNVHVLDHASQEDLINKYKDVADVDTSKIEGVDFVWRGEELSELVGGECKYDYIVASHVVEHTPDLVAFLRQCGSILKDGGILSLVIPDKRYCFDYFRGISTTGDVLQAHLEQRRLHTVGTVFDHFAYQVFMDGRPSWGAETAGELAFSVPFEEALKMANAAKEQDRYLDVHNWRFTPSSFRLIVNDLARMKLIDLHIECEYPTSGCEFFVSFVKRSEDALLLDRFAVASCAAAELEMQRPQLGV